MPNDYLSAKHQSVQPTVDEVLQELRKYNASSIVAHAINTLWHQYPTAEQAVQSAPWLTCLLVKWALRDSQVGLRVGPDMPLSVFDELRQKLWDTGGIERASNVFLMIRAILAVQIEFQRKANWGFLRWPGLVSKAPEGSKARRIFLEQIGMQPEAFQDLAFVFYSSVLDHTPPFSREYFEALRPFYGPNLDVMLGLLCKNLPDLRLAIRNDSASKLSIKQEIGEFPYLKQYPLLKHRNGDIYCWHPIVLARGIEEAIHLRLSSLGETYTLPFSNLFENYVVELASELNVATVSEDEYWKRMGQDASAVEMILPFKDCNILVEAKLALFSDDVLLTDNDTAVFRKTKNIRQGIRKAWTVSSCIRDNKEHFPECGMKEDFLLLVTNRELYVGTGEHLQRLHPNNPLDNEEKPIAETLPLSHIFILSLSEFEYLSSWLLANKDVQLPDLLRKAVKDNTNAATSKHFISQHLAEYKRPSAPTPKFLKEARGLSEKRLMEALKEPKFVSTSPAGSQ